MKVFKLVLLVALLLLDVLVITPWVASLFPPEPGVERAFWGALIPIATSLIGAMTKKKKQPTGVIGDGAPGDMNDAGGGGFNWGAAAPYLIGGGAGALIGSMVGGRGSSTPKAASPLDNLLNYQMSRMQQAEPLQQSILAMQAGMMPTYMKQPGGGVDQWLQGHAAANRSAQLQQPTYQLPGARYPNA